MSDTRMNNWVGPGDPLYDAVRDRLRQIRRQFLIEAIRAGGYTSISFDEYLGRYIDGDAE
jgi:hypothetical protein